MEEGKGAGVKAEAVDTREKAAVEQVSGNWPSEAEGMGGMDSELMRAAGLGVKKYVGGAVEVGAEYAVFGYGFLA